MKKVRMGTLKDKERENALNEVRILASVCDPYIVGYKEAFIDEESQLLCIVMEYATDGDLQNMIQQAQKKNIYLPEEQIWRALYQMTKGLKKLHDLKIVHRDLKCANIFIQNGVFKLGDLNVSKVAKRGLVYTQTGTPCKKIKNVSLRDYASPEVWRDEPYDMRSDIWSMGCVVYEMAALKPPFRATDMQGLYKKVQKGIFEPIPKKYSKDLQTILSGMIQVQPSKRPTCAQITTNPLVLKHLDLTVDQPSNQKNELLQTIQLPKQFKALKDKLPKSKYDNNDVEQLSKSQERLIEKVNEKAPLQRVYSALPLQSNQKQKQTTQNNSIQQKQEKYDIYPAAPRYSLPAKQRTLPKEQEVQSTISPVKQENHIKTQATPDNLIKRAIQSPQQRNSLDVSSKNLKNVAATGVKGSPFTNSHKPSQQGSLDITPTNGVIEFRANSAFEIASQSNKQNEINQKQIRQIEVPQTMKSDKVQQIQQQSQLNYNERLSIDGTQNQNICSSPNITQQNLVQTPQLIIQNKNENSPQKQPSPEQKIQKKLEKKNEMEIDIPFGGLVVDGLQKINPMSIQSILLQPVLNIQDSPFPLQAKVVKRKQTGDELSSQLSEKVTQKQQNSVNLDNQKPVSRLEPQKNDKQVKVNQPVSSARSQGTLEPIGGKSHKTRIVSATPKVPSNQIKETRSNRPESAMVLMNDMVRLKEKYQHYYPVSQQQQQQLYLDKLQPQKIYDQPTKKTTQDYTTNYTNILPQIRQKPDQNYKVRQQSANNMNKFDPQRT